MSCIFQWATAGPVTNVKVYNQTLGTATDLSASASYTFDNRTGVISLTITKIRLWDAGNYSASVTTGTANVINSEALLYVCGSSGTSVSQTAGRNPPTEGDSVELSCTVHLISSPAAYRRRLFYVWSIAELGTFENIYNGPALFPKGDVIAGYSIINNGRTLVIASAQYQHTKGIYCHAVEESCFNTYKSAWLYLPLRYRPHITLRNPVSGKYNPVLYENVSISFVFNANPSITSMTNWSFVSADGQPRDLPSNAESSPFSTFQQITVHTPSSRDVFLDFNFTSISYYGNYSRTVTNSIGSTTETFQLLPQGSPDQPLSFKVLYASHAEVVLQYSCGWDNGRQQTIFIQLCNIDNGTVLSTWNTTLYLGAYNYTDSTALRQNIEAEKEYEARAWSSNTLGSSDVVKLRVKTAKQLKFNVSPETIRFNGSQAIINFSTSNGNVTRLSITCCSQDIGFCKKYDISLYSTKGVQITQVACDNIPNGNDYLFDFVVHSGNPYQQEYFPTMIKGLKVSRTGITQLDDTFRTGIELFPQLSSEKCNSSCADQCEVKKYNALYIHVIVLTALLGVSTLALIGCLILLYLFRKAGSQIQPANVQESTHME